jgi:hypothetical protein
MFSLRVFIFELLLLLLLLLSVHGIPNNKLKCHANLRASIYVYIFLN